MTELAFDADFTAKQFHDLLTDMQPQSHALAYQLVVTRLVEGLEDRRQVFLRDSFSGVLHFEAEPL